GYPNAYGYPYAYGYQNGPKKKPPRKPPPWKPPPWKPPPWKPPPWKPPPWKPPPWKPPPCAAIASGGVTRIRIAATSPFIASRCRPLHSSTVQASPILPASPVTRPAFGRAPT